MKRAPWSHESSDVWKQLEEHSVVLCISPPNCFHLAGRILGYLLPSSWTYAFPWHRQNCTLWSIIFTRAWAEGHDQSYRLFLHVVF